ncbi:MAG: hypothetical protein GY804_11520 [Alphaproteobacteria bacterium]|nr:hypothetical protein [Alphaproteobacteria bacterium]
MKTFTKKTDKKRIKLIFDKDKLVEQLKIPLTREDVGTGKFFPTIPLPPGAFFDSKICQKEHE